MTRKAQSIIQIDNEKVRVICWNFAPNAETGIHKHEMDYIVVPGLDGDLELVDAETGERSIAHLSAGVSYFKPKGVYHNVINANDHDFFFVEIELKE